jgi:hypothetical protein
MDDDRTARDLERAGFELISTFEVNSQRNFGEDRWIARCEVCSTSPTSVETWERYNDERLSPTIRSGWSDHRYRVLPCKHSTYPLGHLPVVTITRAPAPFWERLVASLRKRLSA